MKLSITITVKPKITYHSAQATIKHGIMSYVNIGVGNTPMEAITRAIDPVLKQIEHPTTPNKGPPE